eukprot:scaffold1659_cov255-Pinguiococcus_pyrenoidosus.AAC.34
MRASVSLRSGAATRGALVTKNARDDVCPIVKLVPSLGRTKCAIKTDHHTLRPIVHEGVWPHDRRPELQVVGALVRQGGEIDEHLVLEVRRPQEQDGQAGRLD